MYVLFFLWSFYLGLKEQYIFKKFNTLKNICNNKSLNSNLKEEQIRSIYIYFSNIPDVNLLGNDGNLDT